MNRRARILKLEFGMYNAYPWYIHDRAIVVEMNAVYVRIFGMFYYVKINR